MKKILSILAALALALALFAGCGTKDETISINGSTSMERLVAVLIEAFNEENPDIIISQEFTGSGAGITAAQNGTADIGMSSRELKDSETGLDAIVIARDGIAVIVHPDNPVRNLTRAQLSALFTGETGNWSEVGGADAPVEVVGREAGSGTRAGFEEILGIVDNCAYDQELTSGGAIITAVSTNVNAIGYTSVSAVTDVVRAVSVDGVACTEDTVRNGSYAVQRPFLFVIPSGAVLSEAAEAFIEFARSEAAAEYYSIAGVVQAR